MRVAGHSAEIRTGYLPNTRVVLPPNAAVEWLAPPPDSYPNSSCSNLGSDIDCLVKGSSFYPMHPGRFRDVNL